VATITGPNLTSWRPAAADRMWADRITSPPFTIGSAIDWNAYQTRIVVIQATNDNQASTALSEK
jgi:hypothetical protein